VERTAERTAEIDIAIRRGVAYLLSSQASDGSWSDFEIMGYGSCEWITGAVVVALDTAASWVPVLSDRSSLSKARGFLRATRRASGGWGWCPSIGPDVDSTAVCVAALKGTLSPAECRQVTDFVLLHQADAGGFATYLPSSLTFERPAFCVPSPCVTGNVLTYCRDLLPAAVCTRAGQSIRAALGEGGASGVWRGIWWDGWAHTTTLAVRGLSGTSDLAAVDSTVRNEVHARVRSRLGDDSLSAEPSALVAASILGTLVNVRSQTSSGALRQLLDMQATDGSWSAPECLRFVKSDDLRPWERPHTHPRFSSSTRVYPTAFAIDILGQARAA
jgi:hypothetical protein